MSKFKELSFSGNKGTTIVLGDDNQVIGSQNFLETSSTQVNSDVNWDEVISNLQKLQAIIRGLPDEFEDIRDQQLVPELSKLKSEAKQLAETPKSNSSEFIQKFSNLFKIASNSAKLVKDLIPTMKTIGSLVGIDLPE